MAYASLTQVGLIVAEIGCGLRYIPLVHMIGHACLRTLQLIRAPSLLHDYHTIENAIGPHRTEKEPERSEPAVLHNLRTWLYRFSMERGFLDELLNEYIVRPFVAIFRWCDRMERRWTGLLSGGESVEVDNADMQSGSLEEFI
jgi:NAD(P)H-quinone oxidoreductase subunit 5